MEYPTSLMGAKVKIISRATASKVVREEHYSHNLPPRAFLHYGIYFPTSEGEILGGVASYGSPLMDADRIIPILKAKEIIELVRLAIYRFCPKNTGSFLISKSLRILNKERPNIKLVLAYTDLEQHHLGFVYQASNFYFLGFQQGNRGYLIDGQGNLLHPKGAYERFGTSSPKRLNMKVIRKMPKLVYAYPLVKDDELLFWLHCLKQDYIKSVGSLRAKTLPYQGKDGGSIPTPTLQGRLWKEGE